MRYEIRPFPGGRWTDPETEDRTRAFFRAGWAHTLELLGREAEWLGAALVVLQLDVTDGDLRRDGMLRANAKVGHPGVIVSFGSTHGPLRYASDKFDSWRDNVRGIALALQALRAVDRYGVTRRGEQYIGWKALPAPAAGFTSADEALAWMYEQAGGGPGMAVDEVRRTLVKRFHPDRGGDQAEWARLDEAWRLVQPVVQA